MEDGLPLSKKSITVRERNTGEAVVQKHDGLLQENSLLPVTGWDSPVATLSVFSQSGWVSRRLSPKELAVSFDLPVGLHKEWLKASKELPFLTSTPSKVLMSVSSAMAREMAGVEPALPQAGLLRPCLPPR